MDISTIVGILSGIFFILFTIIAGGGLSAFVNAGGIMITLGGTLAATLINYPLPDVIRVSRVAMKAFSHKSLSSSEVLATMVDLATKARRQGMLALDNELKEISDDFLRTGLALAVDGMEAEFLKEVLDTELDYIEGRHEVGQQIFTSMGAYAPAFGLIGTLIGLILMLRSITDPSTIGPGMAVALLTTFYGAFLSNLIFLPIAGKLKARTRQELMLKELMREGILAIQSGYTPRMVEQKLLVFIESGQREQMSQTQKSDE